LSEKNGKKMINGRMYKDVVIKPRMVTNGPGRPAVPIVEIPDGFVAEGYPGEDGSWRGYIPVEPRKVKVRGASER